MARMGRGVEGRMGASPKGIGEGMVGLAMRRDPPNSAGPGPSKKASMKSAGVSIGPCDLKSGVKELKTQHPEHYANREAWKGPDTHTRHEMLGGMKPAKG